MSRSRCFLHWQLVAGSLALAGWAGHSATAYADNSAPPLGAIFDLSGGSVLPYLPKLFSFDFIAESASTPVAFAFRDDPSFIDFFDVSVVNVKQPSVNLLANSDFSHTSNIGGLPRPDGWTYTNLSGASFGGYVSTKCGGPAYCWVDGSVQGYDEIAQTVSTTVGSVYHVSFEAAIMGGVSTWSRVSTNNRAGSGGNGADIAAFALRARQIPEPSTWATLAIGFAGLAYLGYRRHARAAAPA